MYIKFCNFGPYADVKVSGKVKDESNTDVYQKVRLYKRISAVFIILTLVLLAVVLALAMKLNEAQSSQKCADLSAEVQTMPNYPLNQGYRCTVCEKGWLKFENSCYFIARTRLTWQQSREDCQTRGGDLAVIDNEGLQKRLTEIRSVLYWIGLRYSEKQWMWINNTAPTKSKGFGQENKTRSAQNVRDHGRRENDGRDERAHSSRSTRQYGYRERQHGRNKRS
ncbi:natural killer cells antigen CD94 isoform X4 [Ictalurus furcatus]|uniref:natural killer cells antigen CD94 isoform X4 n=1 Tax=Ictalurus furcatus TaxID=66913 RepID=UPI002350F6D7|nr:natural killer cells antigen CD94 isoform X4 [Ictalurus furcatus]